jgi:hypothetical protein
LTPQALRDLGSGLGIARVRGATKFGDESTRELRGYRLLFGGSTHPVIPPDSVPDADLRTVLGVEVGYWLLACVDSVREVALRSEVRDFLLRFERSPFHWARSSLLARFMPSTLELQDNEVDVPWVIEASRRVVHVHGRGTEPRPATFIFHVFAESPDNDVEQLFAKFLDSVQQGEPPARLTDPRSQRVLLPRPAGHVARRFYWAVNITREGVDLPAGFAQAAHSWTDVWQAGSRLVRFRAQIEAESMAVSDNSSVDGEAHDGLALASARADRDWALVDAAITTATKDGRPLDDEFVEEMARRRFEEARRTYAYAQRSNAGPSLESSRRIVRDIIEMHSVSEELGTDFS